jgi:hypothetical protein
MRTPYNNYTQIDRLKRGRISGRLFNCLAAFLFGILFLLPGKAAAIGNKQPAGKAITVVKEDGVWWFKDTDGRKFYSTGVCCIAGCYGHSEPKPLDPAVEAQIASRLASWGFNTAGSWSSPTIWKHLYVVDQIYSLFRMEESDVFDENFWEPVFRKHVASEIATFPDKSRLIGYCLDNELLWPADEIYRTYLKRKAGTPGSLELVSFTSRFYQGDISRLNKEWSTTISGFAGLPGMDLPAKIPYTMRELMAGWRTHVVDVYYRRYSGLVRELDPGRLILGVRWAWSAEKEVYVAASKYFDVNTLNSYNRYGDLGKFPDELYQNTGKPVMITEFTFSGYPKPGKPSRLFCEVYSEGNRALGYRKYMLEAARAPFMVGMHWFMWADYAAKEGQKAWPETDHNVGLVTKDFKAPYRELVEECARTNRKVAGIHARSKSWRKKAGPAPVPRDIPYFVPTVDGNLGEWPERTRMKPVVTSSLLDRKEAGQTFFLSHDDEYFYLGASVTDDRLDAGDGLDPWSVDHFRLWFPMGEALDTDPMGESLDSDEGISYYVFPTGYGSSKDEAFAGADPGEAPGTGWMAVRKGGAGKYSIEARLPLAFYEPDKGNPVVPYVVYYRDMSGIRETMWSGRGRLAPAVTSQEKPK